MLSDAERQELRARIRDAAGAPQPAVVLSEVRHLLRGSAKLTQDAMFCASTLDRLADALVAQTRARRLRTFIVRSVTVEPV
ncbi:MAG TPA: hypothetical protein VM865_05360, partial [Acidobacteriaceae bacterium]|nr:hypothetical protein [Acidobacteriaceae bacterium]